MAIRVCVVTAVCLLICISVLCVQLTSTTADRVYSDDDWACVEQLQYSRVTERVTSLGDVVSSDTESSDTATDSADILRHV